MRQKRFIALAVCIGIVMMSMIGCKGGEESTSPALNNTAAKTGDSEKTKLTAIMLKHPLTMDLKEMEWLTKIQEEANVEITWEEVTADWSQKKGTLLASGDIPDLIIGPNAIADTDFSQFNGLFEDLTPMIEQYAPNIQKMFTEHPEMKTIATQLDGKIYGLPKYQRFWPDTVTRQFINQKWLDNLGLEQPTNWDELYEVLVKFKEEDANGNGDANDEIPFDFVPATDTAGGFGNFHANVLLGGTGIQLSENSPDGFFVEDGVIKNYFTDDRYKELVKFLSKCWKAGLINPEVFTQDYTKYQALGRGSGDTAKVGYTFGWEVTDRVGNELASQYSFLPPLKQNEQSKVEPTWGYDYNMLNYGVNMIQMSSNCKEKEAAMKFIDKFYEPEVSLQVLFGSIGTNIEKAEDGSLVILPPKDNAMDPGTWKWTSSFADNGPMYISDSLNVTLGIDMQSIEEQTAPLQSALDQIDLDKDVLPRMFIKMSTEDNNQQALIRTNILGLAMGKWASWITDGNIDAQWDQYLKDMDTAGLKELTVLWQKYYDDYSKK